MLNKSKIVQFLPLVVPLIFFTINSLLVIFYYELNDN